MKAKRILSLVLALVLCLSVWSIASADDLSEEVHLVFYVMGDAPKDQAVVEEAINAKLKEKLNATIEFQFSTWTDFQTHYSDILRSNGADMVYSANWLNFGANAANGAFLELDDLLAQYPEFKERIGDSNIAMCSVISAYDGESYLYCIPNLWPEYVCLGIKYREDLRAKYDLPYPTTWENFEAYLLGIQANEPDQPLLRTNTTESANSNIIGFDIAYLLAQKYAWVAPYGLPYGMTANYDTPADTYDYWFSDDFVEDCKTFKRWADQGFWTRSALADTNDSEAYDHGLAVAEVAGMNPNKQITSMNAFINDGHEDWVSAYIAYGETTGVIYPAHATQNGTAILRGCKNPERAFAVLEYIMTDEEMNRLVQAGIEGVHYTLTEDGLYEAVTKENSPFGYEGFNTWNLRVTEFKLKQGTDVVLQAMFDKYAELGAKTKWNNTDIFSGFSEDETEYSVEKQNVMNVMRTDLAKLQAGLVDDVDAAVEEFRTKVKAAGLDVCREGYLAQWAQYCQDHNYQ